jgi:U1 small nuclear ribonucleoprotein C
MGRFYCDYCHCYLTYNPSFLNFGVVLTCRHDSASVRKAHNLGRNHLQQVREYYQKLGFEKTQSVIDSLTQDYQSQVLQATTPNPFAAGLAGGSLPSLIPLPRSHYCPVPIIPTLPYPYAIVILEQVLTYT